MIELSNKKRRVLKKNIFIKNHENLSKEEYDLELLYSQQLIYDKLEKIRSNTSSIVWFIIIGIILSILVAVR